MIVVEGPDCVGKTTFCNKLIQRLRKGYIYSHFTKLPYGFDRYWDYTERMSRKIVQDRFHMSDIAYYHVRGKDARISPEEYRLIDARLRQLGGFTVVILATQELIESRHTSDQMFDLEKTLEAAIEYRRIVEGDYPGYVDADYDALIECNKQHPFPDDSDLLSIIEDYEERQEEIERIAVRKPILYNL